MIIIDMITTETIQEVVINKEEPLITIIIKAVITTIVVKVVTTMVDIIIKAIIDMVINKDALIIDSNKVVIEDLIITIDQENKQNHCLLVRNN